MQATPETMPLRIARRRPSGHAALRYGLVAPAVFILLLIGLYPFVKLLVTSVQNISMMDDDTSFQGLMQFQRLAGDGRLWWSLVRTLLFAAVALPLELLFGFVLALMFLGRVPLRQLFIGIILMPTIISPIVAGSTWRLMFDQRFGPINQMIGWVAGADFKLLWTIDPTFVWPAVMVAEVWQWTPFMFLLLLAALSNLDREQLESAALDGAPITMVFRRIVLPAILPVMFIAILIRALDLVRVFDVIWTMTQGGPGTMTETLSIYAYQLAFREFDVSYSAAIALLVIVVLTALVMWVLSRVEVAR
ncbi:carbohydrate ABC transporter permease [Methyloraptor flagellatus]|uniref:Sugar ABC transporter permease n=1 Tax=Methyloraptor flagellatus TaxID=3162530 RepID=A0AAU7XD22_9HYPH